MSHTPHELAEDFPPNVVQIATLRQSDTHFSRLCDAYHAINRAIHRAETNVEPTTDDHLTELKKRRLGLKDDIARWLSGHQSN